MNILNLGERIKKVRKEKDLTQQEFGEKIGVKQNTIALIESGKRNTSDQLLLGICREFNVSEEWLRTGKGEIFQPTPETTVDKLIQEFKLDDLDRQIIVEYLQLSEQDRKAIKNYIQKVTQHTVLTDKTIHPQKLLEQEADEFAAMARDQFLLERKKESQVSSAKESRQKYIQKTTANFHPLTDEEIEKEVEDYRRELIEEKRAREKLSASQDLKEG